MNSITDGMYISIESRKGGVGKTTTALALAEVLLEKGFQVLLFDMDIAGTSLDESFVVSRNNLIHEVRLGGKTLNLVSTFKSIYLSGKNIPSFSCENDSSFSYAPRKCNIIISNIYDIPEGTQLIEDPRVLNDAFHAYWLLEYVKGICKSFTEAVGQKQRTAFIFDNSPGFSSMENAIHDFLTDLGPEKGKVLLVSSIDPQDIKACRQSVSIIENLYKEKTAAGEYYRSLIKGDKGVKKDSPAFKAVWNSLCATNGRCPEYYACSHKNEIQFINLLVNKVPKRIFEKLFEKDILKRNKEKAVAFQNHLLYFFSEPQLAAAGINHQQDLKEERKTYYLSGDITKILDDDKLYKSFCKYAQQMELGGFFKEEWAPLSCLRDLLESIKGHDALVNIEKWELKFEKPAYADQNKLMAAGMNFVVKFVEENTRKESRIMKILPKVKNSVNSVLEKQLGSDCVELHIDNYAFQGFEDFVDCFSLAVYRIHIYSQVCAMLNLLIQFCIGNFDNIEMIDTESVNVLIDDKLDGRLNNKDGVESLGHILDSHENARELRKTLREIVDTWAV